MTTKTSLRALIAEYRQSAVLLRHRRLQLTKESKSITDISLLRDFHQRIELLRQEETEISEDVRAMQRYQN